MRFAVPAVLLGLVVAVVVAAARRDRDDEQVRVVQSEPGDGAGTADDRGTPGSGSNAAARPAQPQALPTAGDPKRWEVPAARLPPLKSDSADEADVGVEAARDEAAALRREAVELRAALDRLQAQEKRGARVRSENAESMRRRTEDLEEQIGDLQHRAQDLDGEAADLEGKEAPAADANGALHPDMDDTVVPDADPLSGDLEDPLDDEEVELE